MTVIIETTVFTRQVQELLSEEEYRLLQIALLQNPESGVLIPHSGGCAKNVGPPLVKENVEAAEPSIIGQQGRIKY